MTIRFLTIVHGAAFNLPRSKECYVQRILLKRLSEKIPKYVLRGFSSSKERIKQPASSLVRFGVSVDVGEDYK
jgi:hypothetical protein